MARKAASATRMLGVLVSFTVNTGPVGSWAGPTGLAGADATNSRVVVLSVGALPVMSAVLAPNSFAASEAYSPVVSKP